MLCGSVRQACCGLLSLEAKHMHDKIDRRACPDSRSERRKGRQLLCVCDKIAVPVG